MAPVSNKNLVYIPLLSLAAISFILGIVYAFYFKVSFIIFYLLAVAVLLFLAYVNKRQNGGDVLIVLALFLIGLLHQTNFAALPLDDIYYLSKLNLGRVTVEGTAASPVQRGPFNKSFVFYPRVIEIAGSKNKVSGKVYVRFNKWIDLNYGDQIIIQGKLADLKDKGYFNKSLIRQGINTILSVGKRDWIARTGQARFSIKKTAFEVKEKLKQRFNNLSSPAKDILIAFILGNREGLSKEIYSVFRYTGTVHILAISGLHIGIIIFIFILFLKILRLKLKVRFVITVLFLLFYSFMTGLRPSVVRAVIMGITFLLSFIVKREYHIYNSLALAAMIILGIWPWQIFDVGFQLSFISVLSIVFIYPKILAVLPKVKNRFLSFIKASFVVSLSACIGTAPLVAYYFGMISPVSAIANIFIVALMPFILAGGFIYLFVSFFAPVFLKWFTLSIEFMVDLLIFLSVYFKNMPFSYFYVERFGIFMLFMYYGFILIFFNSCYLIKFFRAKR